MAAETPDDIQVNAAAAEAPDNTDGNAAAGEAPDDMEVNAAAAETCDNIEPNAAAAETPHDGSKSVRGSLDVFGNRLFESVAWSSCDLLQTVWSLNHSRTHTVKMIR